MIGNGNIAYGSPPSAGNGGLVFAGADNGVSLDPSNVVVLGEDIGAVGQPGKLLSAREIPLDNFFLRIINSGVNTTDFRTSPDPQIKFTNAAPTTQIIIEIQPNQGYTPPPNPANTFGNYYMTLDCSFLNPDGQFDNVLSIGYNQNGVGGKVNPNEAAFATVVESHFLNGPEPSFEWYLTSYAEDGATPRHLFLVVNKVNGGAVLDYEIDSFQVKNTASAGGLQYAGWDDTGLSLINAYGTHDLTFQMISNNVPVDGGIGMTLIHGSGGNFLFSMAGGLTAPVWGFEGGLFAVQGKQVGANPNSIQFSSTDIVPTNRIFAVVANSGEMAQFYVDGHVALNPTFIGFISSATPRAYLELAGGTTAPNQAPLFFGIGTFNTNPVQGTFEYDGTTLTFVRSAARESILTAATVAAPALSAGAAFTHFYGTSSTNILGDPNQWATVVIAGTTYKIPLYT